MDTASSCQSCGQSISKDELAEGLAVRVDGRLVCSSCVDQLPGEAQVRINQLRAVRGLEATTYRVASPLHPHLARFTFTTTMNMNVHRRELVTSGHFDAPLLPATGAPKLVLPSLPPTPAQAAAVARGRRILLVASAAVVLVTVGVIIAIAKQPTAVIPSHAGTSLPTVTKDDSIPAVALKKRTDYAANSAIAWSEAVHDPHCPMPILQEIAGQLVSAQMVRIATTEQLLNDGDLTAAADSLADVASLPDHVLFRTINKQTADVAERIRMARVNAAATAAKAPTPKPAPEPKPEPEPTQPEPPPEAHIPDPTPPVAAVIPPAKPDPIPPLDLVAAGDCFHFPAKKLKEIIGRKNWKLRSTDDLVLDSESGSLVVDIPVSGGTYQLWIKGKALAGSGTVGVMLASQRSAHLQMPASKTSGWLRIDGAFVLKPGIVNLQIVAIGAGTVLGEVYLAEATKPHPDQAIKDKLTSSPAWDAGSPAPLVPPAPARPAWIARFAETHAICEEEKIPLGLPGNAGEVLESAKIRASGRHGFTIEVSPDDVLNGGMAVLICPQRPDRQLTVIAMDAAGQRMALDPLPLTKEAWQIHLIDLSLATGIHHLLIEDAKSLSTGFLLAKIAVIAGAAPTPELLELRPPALLPVNGKDLDNQLTFLALRRKAPIWRKSFDPKKVKILIGQKLTAGSWESDARKRIADVLGINRLPNKTIEALVMNDDWLDALVKPPPGADMVLDPAEHHIAILCTAGIEFPTGLDQRQAFVNFWKKLITDIRMRGILPIPALGPSKVDSDDIAEVEALWVDLASWLAKEQPGIPAIDLRPAKAASANRFAPGASQLSIELLGDGYGILLRRIETLRKTGK